MHPPKGEACKEIHVFNVTVPDVTGFKSRGGVASETGGTQEAFSMSGVRYDNT